MIHEFEQAFVGAYSLGLRLSLVSAPRVLGALRWRDYFGGPRQQRKHGPAAE